MASSWEDPLPGWPRWGRATIPAGKLSGPSGPVHRFAADDLLSGTPEEKAQAMEGFVACAGRYSFHGDRVIHHVELSLFPNWVGSDQERSVKLAGDRLILSASPLLLASKQQVSRLVWERVDPSPGAA